jgi:hypothetical protein
MIDNEPMAWAVMLADGYHIYDVYAVAEEAKAIDEVVAGNHGVISLYRSFTLTDAEREAVEWFASYGYSSDGVPGRNAATLRGLLERTSDRT